MSTKTRTLIIAEAGVNHNGSLELAKTLIDCASRAGADIVKFQTFQAQKLVSRGAAKAQYQLESTGGANTQLEMLKRLELKYEDHRPLIDHCKARGIEFLSTPFDLESVDFLSQLGVSRYKVASGEILNAPYLLKIARLGKPVILSTGMSDLSEIKEALGVLAFGFLPSPGKPSREAFKQAFETPQGQAVLREQVTLLHCTTEYPAPFEEVNLRAMDTLSQTFGLSVGYSDHTIGITVPVAAVARGATVIEKHFTTDRGLPGPDHRASLEPGELAAMIQAIREAESALGSPIKGPTPSELKNREVARKSLVAGARIRKGELFNELNLSVKRPGSGLSPMLYWDWLGKPSPRDFEEDDLILGS